MTDSSVPRRTTLADIARRLGVSVATVSLALRNDPQISKTRRADIARVAAEMGYRPDPMLSALNRYRHHAGTKSVAAGSTIAWINRWCRPAALRDFHEFDEYWEGAVEMAAAAGYRLEEIVWDEAISGARLRGILRARGIRGVLIPPAERNYFPTTALSWRDFPWSDFAAVRLGRSVSCAPCFPVVGSDQVYNCRLAYNELRRRGHSRIGFVTSGPMTDFTLTLGGFLMAQMAQPANMRLPPLVLETTRPARPPATFKRWLAHTRPDAILTDEKTVRRWLDELRIRVPQNLVLVALSILDGDSHTGIDQNSREIGRTAVEVLISSLDRHVHGIPAIGRETLIQGLWVEEALSPATDTRSARSGRTRRPFPL
jgi:LacI family transcriptional regulator